MKHLLFSKHDKIISMENLCAYEWTVLCSHIICLNPIVKSRCNQQYMNSLVKSIDSIPNKITINDQPFPYLYNQLSIKL